MPVKLPWGLGEFLQPRLRLLQEEPHVHHAVHRRRGGEVLMRLLALVRAAVEPAEAEVAVGNERAHAARLGEGQRLGVVGLSALTIELIRMSGEVTEQMSRMGCESRETRGGFERALAQMLCLAEPTQQQT